MVKEIQLRIIITDDSEIKTALRYKGFEESIETNLILASIFENLKLQQLKVLENNKNKNGID